MDSCSKTDFTSYIIFRITRSFKCDFRYVSKRSFTVVIIYMITFECLAHLQSSSSSSITTVREQYLQGKLLNTNKFKCVRKHVFTYSARFTQCVIIMQINFSQVSDGSYHGISRFCNSVSTRRFSCCCIRFQRKS